ncbi:MAG: DUF2207 domain-containing protein [Candidatus Omnitrophota bacterium]|jgi:uncharacterized membrane protein YgcG
MQFRKIILLFFICLLATLPSYAQNSQSERILSYDTQVTVNEDSTMTVTENIKVIARGKEIKRGIYRDFPTNYKGRHGNDLIVDFNVIEVLRNGLRDDYRVTSLSNGKRVYIGNKDVYLTPGEYLYTITYKTDRQLGFFKGFDELYWNVTGNGWLFAIDEVSAMIALPQDAGYKLLETTGYTGYRGSRGKDVAISKDSLGRTIFTTTRPLASGEGLTIVLTWPKGYVKEPTLETKIKYAFRDNSGGIIGLLSLFILIGYYLIVWGRVGKDPEKGTIIPLYEPPAKLSPADMRYIMKMGYDDKIFTATIIDMAVKGALKISEEKWQYTLEKNDGDRSLLTKDEIRVSEIIFASGKKLELKNTNFGIMKKAIKYIKDYLRLRYEKIYFLTNKEHFIPGVVLSLVLMFVSVVFQSIGSGHPEKLPIALFMTVWLSGWTFGVFALLFTAFSLWRASLKNAAKIPEAIFLTLFSIPFLMGEMFGISMLLYSTSFLIMTIVLAVIITNALFYYLLKAPTFMGRKIMDRIEGFKMYLSVAEENRLNVLHPPEETPQLFEKYLPYALALDVEQKWAERFSGVLERASASGEHYHPSWYAGASFGAFSVAGFAASLGSGFATAISSSSVAPGSSSGGGGGGGSSGGGGGGGGGGGW